MKKVICIVGPTGSGKTKLSIELAKRFQMEVINGDSVSIYKELNIGSAKITEDEMNGVKHHLISHRTLNEPYSVFNFQKDVRQLISQIQYPLIVGGSGLYIKSALYDYEFEEQEKKELPEISQMIEFIKENDPDIDLDWHNERRIVSAYQTIISGKKRSDKNKLHHPLYDIYLIYLDMDRNILRQRVEYRLNQMIEKGFIEETKTLMAYDLNIIGYRELKGYLNHELTLEDAINTIITQTMRFAKRQKTWFMNQMNPNVYDGLSPDLVQQVSKDIEQFLKG